MARLTHLALEGKYDEARKLNAQLLPLMQANFIETNPIPVKAGPRHDGHDRGSLPPAHGPHET